MEFEGYIRELESTREFSGGEDGRVQSDGCQSTMKSAEECIGEVVLSSPEC